MQSEIALGIIISLLIICVIILFCVILIKLHINKIKNYTRLIYQKDIDFQIALNTTILETQEQVLNNISQDLHDDAGQQLTYINFQIENLKLDSTQLHAMLQPLSVSVHGLSDSIRSISHSLNHQLLMKQDLYKAIEAEVKRLQKNSPIRINLSIPPDVNDFAANEKIVVYRIFQEIINNIFKHAKATEVNIAIKSDPFIMSVSDDGKGFDMAGEQPEKQSLGLQSMMQRAAIIDYSLDIHSEPGKGTIITLSEKLS
jgi:signal transduction histidine kinase